MTVSLTVDIWEEFFGSIFVTEDITVNTGSSKLPGLQSTVIMCKTSKPEWTLTLRQN